MSTGEVLRVRAAMKPISTVPRALRTVDVATGEPAKAINQRSDVCAVPAAGVVAEAMVALVLADAALEKFGGDSVEETRRNAAGYLDTSRSGDRAAAPRAGRSPGSGKTTVGGAWPSGSAWPSGTPTPTSSGGGQTIAEIFVDDGEAHFRELERAAVATALAEHDGVLALGGGAVLDAATRRVGWPGTVVFLDVGITDAASASGSTVTGRCSSATPARSGCG